MGVGKEAHVEDEVGVGRDAVLVAEADDGDEHGASVGIFEALGDEVAELMDIELRGIDHDIGELADGLHDGAFVMEAFTNGESFAKGMRAAGFAVTAEESVVGGVNKDEGNRMVLAEVL